MNQCDLFSNGAGKLLLYEMLTMIAPRDYAVAISTPNNSMYDWCGVYSKELNISGVVDLHLKSDDVDILGEIKGQSGSTEHGLWQLAAVMSTDNCKHLCQILACW